MALEKTRRWPLIGGILAALAASLCCVGPLVLVMLGLGGAWVASLAALEPDRPIFLGLGVIFLFLAYQKIYRAPTLCATESVCAKPQTARLSKILFWLVAGLMLFAIVFPYFAPLFY